MHRKMIIAAAFAACALVGAAAAGGYEERLDSADYRACKDTTSGIGQAACANAELDLQDAALNAAYKSLMARTASPVRRDELRDAERQWIRRRDAKCNHAGDDFEGGTQQNAMIAMCNVSETEARILYRRSLGGR